MLRYLKGLKMPVTINGKLYADVDTAISELKGSEGNFTVVLNKAKNSSAAAHSGIENSKQEQLYKIKVRQYMTRPSTPEFDFHDKWNNGNPMPMRIMVGRKIKETRGMIKMELWGDIVDEISTYCVRCGRVLTNDVSKYLGIGPECGGHNYNNPFDTEEELSAAVAEVRKQLKEIKWAGWVIKSAIEHEETI